MLCAGEKKVQGEADPVTSCLRSHDAESVSSSTVPKDLLPKWSTTDAGPRRLVVRGDSKEDAWKYSIEHIPYLY